MTVSDFSIFVSFGVQLSIAVLHVKIGQKMSELRQRAQKYRFWAQTPKDTKIEKSETVIPQVFAISFREKKVYSNRTTRSMRLVGVVQGQHINTSVPVYSYFIFSYVSQSVCLNIFLFLKLDIHLITLYLNTGTDTLMCRPFTTPTKRILLVVRFE